MYKALAAMSQLCDNVGRMLAKLGLTMLAGSKHNKGIHSHTVDLADYAESSSSGGMTQLGI